MTSSLARSLTANWLGLAVNAMVGLLVPAMVVRSLGSESYGVWAMAISIVGYMALLDLGTRHAIVRYIATYRKTEDSESISKLLSSTLALITVLSWIGVIVMLALAWMLPSIFVVPPNLVTPARLLLVLLAFDGACDLMTGPLSSTLGGIERYDLLQLLNTARVIINGGLAALLLSLGFGLWGVAAALLLSRLLFRVGLIVSIRKLLPTISLSASRVDSDTIVRVLRYGGWTALMILSVRLSYQFDLILIGATMGAVAVTHYAIPLLLVDQVRSIADGASLVLFSRLSSVSSDQWDAKAVSLMDRWARYSPLLPLTVGLHLIFFGEPFISLWIGGGIPNSSAILALLLVPFFITAPTAAYNVALLARSKPAVAAKLQLLEALLNVGLSLILVNRLGLLGVAWGTFLPAVAVQGIVTPMVARHEVNYPWKRFVSHAFAQLPLLIIGYAFLLFLSSRLITADTICSFLIANGLPLIAIAPAICFWYVAPEDRQYLRRRLSAVLKANGKENGQNP